MSAHETLDRATLDRLHRDAHPSFTDQQLEDSKPLKLVRTCPRCSKRFHQFTSFDSEVSRFRRWFDCVCCGHRWLGRVTAYELGDK